MPFFFLPRIYEILTRGGTLHFISILKLAIIPHRVNREIISPQQQNHFKLSMITKIYRFFFLFFGEIKCDLKSSLSCLFIYFAFGSLLWTFTKF